jgi:hypothetical protein
MPSFDFDNGETKLLSTLVNESLKQVAGAGANPQVKQAVSLLEKISYKLQKFKGGRINFTRHEFDFMKKAISENLVSINKQMNDTWFGKRWLMKIMYKQYKSIHLKITSGK